MGDVRSVAVLGTGIMGAPMARNIAAAGLEVRAWNRTAAKAAALEPHGVRPAGSPADAVAGADIVVTMLSDAESVAAAMTDGGALAAIDPSATWLQTSTVGVEGAARLAALAAERELAYVDAPVLGTKAPAEAGELTVLASGPDEALERCEPVFEAIGSRTLRLGPAGAGSRMKLVFNSWIVALVGVLGETLALAEALDLEPAAFLETVAGGPLDSEYAQLKGRAMIDGSFEPSFPLRLAEKDARLVLEAAAAAGLPAGLMRAARESLARALADGHGDEDLAAVRLAAGG
jgi:3-hydroxyisobutyrate dehydrogenase